MYSSTKFIDAKERQSKMSTKITISHDQDIHLYQEIADESRIYLKFKKGGLDVRLEIDVAHALAIARAFDLGRVERMSKITDEDIDDHVRGCVKERLGKDGLAAIFGMLIYGSADEPEERQVENGISYYKGLRENVRKCLEKSKAKDCGRTPFSFGLEEFVKMSSSRP